jgi:hypothetical protein
VSGLIGQQDYIPGEEGSVGAAQVQQHAVGAGNRDDSHAGYTRGRTNALHDGEYRRFVRVRVVRLSRAAP